MYDNLVFTTVVNQALTFLNFLLGLLVIYSVITEIIFLTNNPTDTLFLLKGQILNVDFDTIVGIILYNDVFFLI